MDSRPNTITAEALDGDVEKWAALKDAGQCRFVFRGDYVDGIGEFNGGYIIEYGGNANDPAFVGGDAVINIEWAEVVKCPRCNSTDVMLLRHNYQEDAYLWTDYFCRACRNAFEDNDDE